MTLNPAKIISVSDSQSSVLIPAVLRTRSATARNVPVVGGLCLPRGQVIDTFCGHVEGFASAVDAQFEVLNRWNDGSVRWMLASFVAPEVTSDGRELGIIPRHRVHPGGPTDFAPLDNQAGAIHTEASGAESVEPPRQAGWREGSQSDTTTIKLQDGEIRLITRNLTSDPPMERTLRLQPILRDLNGEQQVLRFDSIREEVVGPVRQVFVISSRIQAFPFVTLQYRLTSWTSVGLLLVETRIRNTRRAKHAGGLWDLGDAGSFPFRSLEISVCSDEISAGATIRWKAERDQPARSAQSSLLLQQFSSGQRYWRSPNHATASGASPVRTRGYSAISDQGTLRGYRAEPTLLIESEDSWLTLAIPEFWQQFPGSVAATARSLNVGLFPAINALTFELQGGEQKTQSFWLSTGSDRGDMNQLDWVYDAPRLLQSSSSIAAANVIPWFSCSPTCPRSGISEHPFSKPAVINQFTAINARFETNRATVNRLEEYLHKATSGAFSLEARRASIDEYGWRNFGDVPADHEQMHYAGSNTVVSHYNNQFDMIFGGILQLAASGDLKWFDLLDPLARHVMDIDIYHTSTDRAAFNGGMFWHTDHYLDAHTCTHRTYSRHNQTPGTPYGGGPGCEHNYTTGLLHYYFLTGNPEARESVLSLAEWVIQMDDGRKTVFGLLDDGPTGAASATVSPDFHGPGRGAGNSINALLDAWLLTGSERFLCKLEELIRRCVHPSQNPHDLHLLDAEGHWSYTVFLNSLGRYLLAKCDAEMFDAMYSYSRDVMSMYGRWMAAHERRTLDHPEQLQYPTEAWAAQDLRKANVLRIAASCEVDEQQAAAMRAKADLISDAAWNDLEAFGSASLTARCLAILMTEGQREVFHRTGERTLIPKGPATGDVGTWSMFRPQKQRVKQLFKSPAQLLMASVLALRPRRIWNSLTALRRQL
jgi:hypothetical protein